MLPGTITVSSESKTFHQPKHSQVTMQAVAQILRTATPAVAACSAAAFGMSFNDTEVYTWGSNQYGEQRLLEQRHACGICKCSATEFPCTLDFTAGQLGLGNEKDQYSPQRVDALSKFSVTSVVSSGARYAQAVALRVSALSSSFCSPIYASI